MKMNKTQANELFDVFSQYGVEISEEYRRKILNKVNKALEYQPRIGVFGKTGAGKSSLCNALFGQDVCSVSDIEACTRDPQEVLLGLESKGIKLLDVPGVGESQERDVEYRELYKNLIPELDLILWVIKGDDRAFKSDEEFYKTLIKPYIKEGMPFIVALNQVDKIEPYEEWDKELRRPGTKQGRNIEEKRRIVAGFFEQKLSQVVAVSANKKYGLVELVDEMIHALPKEKKYIVVDVIKQAGEENVSDNARLESAKGLLDGVIDFIGLVKPEIAQAIKAAKVAAKFVSKGVSWAKEKLSSIFS